MPDTAVKVAHKPVWVDLSSPDLPASLRFYGALFGWTAQEVAGPEAGNYTFFKSGDDDVAGAGSIMMEGQHPAWVVYFGTSNADETAEKIKAAGGTVAFGPMDVFTSGRMCVFSDPSGAFAAIWQAGDHAGWSLMGKANSFGWAELHSRDLPGAGKFFAEVFGWESETMPTNPGMPDYTMWKVPGEDAFAGAMPTMPDVPAQVPSYWLAYFNVGDIDHTVEQAKSLGAEIQFGPVPYPGGRLAVVKDPQGAMFGVIQGS